MWDSFAEEFSKLAKHGLTEEALSELQRLARMSWFNKLEQKLVKADVVTGGQSEMEKARGTVDAEIGYLNKRYNVSPHLVGSMPLGVNIPGDVDVDFVVPIRSPDKFKRVVKRMESNKRYEGSKYNKPGMNHYVFTRQSVGSGDYPVDVGISFGDPAKQFASQRRAMRRSSEQVPEELKRQLVAKKILLKHTPFDIPLGKSRRRYKSWKKALNRALNPLGDTVELGRKSAPLELAKVGRVLNVQSPEGLKELKRFAGRKDVYGHRTHHAGAVLSSGRLIPATEALRRGKLRSYEAGVGGGTHKKVTHENQLSRDQLNRMSSALLRPEVDDDDATDVAAEAGVQYDDAMREFLRRRHSQVKRFLKTEDDPEKFRRRHLSVSKLSPHVFVTKGGIARAPQYGDTQLLVRSLRARPSPFMNLLRGEHIVDPLRPMETRSINVKSGIVIAPESKVRELEAKHPKYRYVVEEHIPEDVKKNLYMSSHSVGEIGRRWLPAALSGRLLGRPR